jgi:hypothetical protein
VVLRGVTQFRISQGREERESDRQRKGTNLKSEILCTVHAVSFSGFTWLTTFGGKLLQAILQVLIGAGGEGLRQRDERERGRRLERS